MKIFEKKITYRKRIIQYRNFIFLRFFNSNHLEIYVATKGKIQNKILADELSFIIKFIEETYIDYLNEIHKSFLNFETINFSQELSYVIIDFTKE